MKRNLVRHCLSILMVTVVIGCTPIINESPKATIRNLAVISAIGDEVSLIRSLGDGDERPERVQWNFDGIATASIIESVRALNPKVSIVPTNYDSNALSADIHQLKSFRSYSDPARIRSELRQITSGTSVDTIILVARDHFSQGALLYYNGVGILTERTLLPRAPITPHAVLALFIIEVPTMRVLSKVTVQNKGSTYNVTPLLPIYPVGGPAPFLPGLQFPMNDEQRAFLRPILQDLVLSGTRVLMRRAGFNNS